MQRLLSLTFAILTCASLARGQDSGTESPAEYEHAIDDGVREFQLGNFQEAREQFARAHEVYPNARTLRGLGMVEFELRNYGASARLLEQSLGSTVKPLDERLRREVTVLLERARGYLGEVHVTTDPPEATVLVDGAVVEVPADQALTLQVGDHVLEFRAHGHLPVRRTVKVRGGTRTTVRERLTPTLDQFARPASDGPQSEAARAPLYKKWWLWTLVGVVVGGGATAAILLSPGESARQRAATTPIGTSLQTLEVRAW